MKSTKAQLPNNSQHLRQTFAVSEEHLKKVFWLPHKVSFEPYKVLNSIPFTNTKLFKIGYISEDKCSFCKSEPETLHNFLYKLQPCVTLLERF